MKMIGEKLTSEEMLNLKGGVTYYMVCTCNHNPGSWEFLADISSNEELEQQVANTSDWACSDGPGANVTCTGQLIQ